MNDPLPDIPEDRLTTDLPPDDDSSAQEKLDLIASLIRPPTVHDGYDQDEATHYALLTREDPREARMIAYGDAAECQAALTWWISREGVEPGWTPELVTRGPGARQLIAALSADYRTRSADPYVLLVQDLVLKRDQMVRESERAAMGADDVEAPGWVPTLVRWLTSPTEDVLDFNGHSIPARLRDLLENPRPVKYVVEAATA